VQGEEQARGERRVRRVREVPDFATAAASVSGADREVVVSGGVFALTRCGSRARML
jgi:hypothetical protein